MIYFVLENFLYTTSALLSASPLFNLHIKWVCRLWTNYVKTLEDVVEWTLGCCKHAGANSPHYNVLQLQAGWKSTDFLFMLLCCCYDHTRLVLLCSTVSANMTEIAFLDVAIVSIGKCCWNHTNRRTIVRHRKKGASVSISRAAEAGPLFSWDAILCHLFILRRPIV